jgi:SAM-dependent methyltransferase
MSMALTISERVIEIPWALSQLPQRGTILDIGSCDATYLHVIQQTGRDLHCMDPRDCPVEIPAGATYYRQSIIGNSLPRAAFDAVLLLSTIEHIGLPCYGHAPFPDGDLLTIAEIWSLLRPQGRLIMTVPAGHGKTASWYRQYSPAMIARLLKGWRVEATYWGYDGEEYRLINESDVEQYDYRDYPYIGAGAGAVAGIVAYLS